MDVLATCSLTAAFRAFENDIQMLKEFVDLNSTGLRKILKKVEPWLLCVSGEEAGRGV